MLVGLLPCLLCFTRVLFCGVLLVLITTGDSLLFVDLLFDLVVILACGLLVLLFVCLWFAGLWFAGALFRGFPVFFVCYCGIAL